jgi:hypothetical protein
MDHPPADAFVRMATNCADLNRAEDLTVVSIEMHHNVFGSN